MEYNFSKMHNVSKLEVKVRDQSIPFVTLIKYIKSIVQNNDEIEEDVNHQIQVGG